MTKRVFVVHRWNGNPNSDWYQWVKNELENIPGFDVRILNMPTPESPDIDSWVNRISEEVKIADKNTYFIGHSVGCQAIMRYLEKVDSKIGGCVFVSGWFKLNRKSFTQRDESIFRPWIYLPIDLKMVKKIIGNITCIFSDDDPYVNLEDNVSIFKTKLNSKILIEKNKGHFTSYDGITKVPEVKEELINMTR